jgi:hypothetical protein
VAGLRARAAAAAALALALGLAQGAAAAPAFLFVGPDWRMAVEAADVFGFQSFAAPGGRIGLSVTLRPAAAERLANLTAASLANRLIVEDGDGGVLIDSWIAQPIRGGFAVIFADGEAARRAARRLQGQE